MPIVDMKGVRSLAAAGPLTTVRPLRTRKINKDNTHSFDIVALFHLVSINDKTQGGSHRSRGSWLRHHLPEAFEDARILSFGDVDEHRLESEFVADIEAFDLNFLNRLLQFRQSTNTVCICSSLFPYRRIGFRRVPDFILFYFFLPQRLTLSNGIMYRSLTDRL